MRVYISERTNRRQLVCTHKDKKRQYATMPIRNRHHAFLAFFAWLIFVVYGSLLPFELRGISLSEAIDTFSRIRFLDLGIVSRADWIANILLYIPLAFLACSWIGGDSHRGPLKALAVPATLLICIGTAVAVEFTQTFYAPRTVSLNDLLAESIGTFLGIAIWSFYGTPIRKLLDAFAEGGRASIYAAISIYGIAYILLALFPYDFIISLDELKWKLSSDHLGWILAGSCGSWLRCGAQMLGEFLAIMPLGLLLSLANRRLSLTRVFVVGAGLSLFLELCQILLASGVSQGASILLRAGGLVGGVMLGRFLHQQGIGPIAKLTRRFALFLAIPYLIAVAALNSWFGSPWVDIGSAADRLLSDVRFLPFYYHYFSTETHAVASLLAQFTMYAPIGILIWARDIGTVRSPSRHFGVVGMAAAMLALPIELGKLFVPPQHPDFTNLLIAASGAMFAYWLAGWITSTVSDETQIKAAADSAQRTPDAPHSGSTSPRDPARPLGVLLSLAALAALGLGIVSYPLYGTILVGFLILYAFALYRQPWLWLLLIPIALPVLDLSPLTGRLLLDAFDLLVLVTIAMGYWRIYPLRPRSWPRHTLGLAVALLWATWVLAFGRGIWGLQNLPESIIASSHTPLEAWFVGKGLLWSLLLVPLLRRLPKDKTDQAQKLFLRGIVIGLALEVAVVFWERQVYVGLTDFENIFRVTGTFASMHTGGAYIEAYLAFAFPILIVWILRQHRWRLRLAGLALVGATAYAMSVTYSRGGYAGLVVSLLVVAIGVTLQRHRTIRGGKLALAGVVLGVIAMGLPVVSGEFAQYRLNRSMEDLNIRIAHWRQAIRIMDDGPLTSLIGMGFGRYPTQYFYRADFDKPPGNFSILRDGEENFLHLNPGDALYLDQIVAMEPEAHYTLSARIRQPQGKAELSIPICEKALLYSFACDWYRLAPNGQGTAWQTVSIPIVDREILKSDGSSLRPIKVSLYNPGKAAPIEIATLSLKDQNGKELLANGSFDNGVERWLFVTDRDLAWHIHQQEVETYFAQGFLGLLALATLLFAVVRVLRRGVMAGCTFALAMAAALAGFLTVGLLGSTVDTARLSMLFYFGSLAAALITDKGRRTRLRPRRSGMHHGFPPSGETCVKR